MTESPTTPRPTRRSGAWAFGLAAMLIVGAFGGGIAGAGVRDSVAHAVQAEQAEHLATCRDQLGVLATIARLRAEAFQALADHDAVTALDDHITANQMQDAIDEQVAC